MSESGSHRAYKRARGLVHGSVRRAIQSGRLVGALWPDGLLDFDIADLGLATDTRPAAAPLGSTNGHAGLVLSEERVQREHYAALRAKREFELADPRLAPADEVRAATFKIKKRARGILTDMRSRRVSTSGSQHSSIRVPYRRHNGARNGSAARLPLPRPLGHIPAP